MDEKRKEGEGPFAMLRARINQRGGRERTKSEAAAALSNYIRQHQVFVRRDRTTSAGHRDGDSSEMQIIVLGEHLYP